MELQRYLSLAVDAATSAGRRLQKVNRDEIVSSRERDLTHRADLIAEKLILEVLSPKTDIPVLSEESGRVGENNEYGFLWVVDPLDGTMNFSQGIPFTAVSIALWKEFQPVVGVVYDFQRDELFTGIVGRGAWCNDEKISASKIRDPSAAILATGFPVNRDFSSGAIQQFIESVQSYKKIRLLGSAALSLSYVAAGRCDAYAEEDIMLWDVAAGIALVRSATGAVNYSWSANKKWAVTVQAGDTF